MADEELPRYLAKPYPEKIGLVRLDRAKPIQIRALTKLMETRVLNAQVREVLSDHIATGKMTAFRAGEWIDWLHKQPWNVDRSGGKDR